MPLFLLLSVLWYLVVSRLSKFHKRRLISVFLLAWISGVAFLALCAALTLLMRKSNGWEVLGGMVLSACHFGVCAVMTLAWGLVRLWASKSETAPEPEAARRTSTAPD